MGLRLNTSNASRFLRVTVAGTFSLLEAKRKFIEVLKAVARTRLGRCSSTAGENKGNPKTIERFYYGTFAAESLGEFTAHGVLFAYISSKNRCWIRASPIAQVANVAQVAGGDGRSTSLASVRSQSRARSSDGTPNRRAVDATVDPLGTDQASPIAVASLKATQGDSSFHRQSSRWRHRT